MFMVVIAQLAEHRIVVPSVVGSSPTLHPKESHTALFSFAILTKKKKVVLLLLFSAYAC